MKSKALVVGKTATLHIDLCGKDGKTVRYSMPVDPGCVDLTITQATEMLANGDIAIIEGARRQWAFVAVGEGHPTREELP